MDQRFDLDPDTVSALDGIVETGPYATREDVLHDGVKLVQQRERKRLELEALLLERLADIEAGRAHDLEDGVQEILAEIDEMGHQDRA